MDHPKLEGSIYLATFSQMVKILFWKPKRKDYMEYKLSKGYSFYSAYNAASSATNDELLDYDKGCMEKTKK